MPIVISVLLLFWALVWTAISGWPPAREFTPQDYTSAEFTGDKQDEVIEIDKSSLRITTKQNCCKLLYSPAAHWEVVKFLLISTINRTNKEVGNN